MRGATTRDHRRARAPIATRAGARPRSAMRDARECVQIFSRAYIYRIALARSRARERRRVPPTRDRSRSDPRDIPSHPIASHRIACTYRERAQRFTTRRRIGAGDHGRVARGARGLRAARLERRRARGEGGQGHGRRHLRARARVWRDRSLDRPLAWRRRKRGVVVLVAIGRWRRSDIRRVYASHASLLCVLYMGVWVYGVCVVGARIYIACACARMGTAWGGVWGAYGGDVGVSDRPIGRPTGVSRHRRICR